MSTPPDANPAATAPAPHAHPRPYGMIFLGLFILTVMEIIVANLHAAKIAVVVALVALAIVKACLVAMFYMHLRFEKMLLALIALSPLAFSIIFTLTIAADLVRR